MTNKPTIDGMSRVSLQQVLEAYDYANSHPHKYLRGTSNWCAAVAHKLNEFQRGLDAPAVERQPAAHRITHNDGYTDGWFNGPPHEGDIEDIKKGVLHRVELAYTDSPEVAALQSTIAQLQAENSRVNDAWHEMKRELDLAKACVQELESGRGEVTLKPFRDLPYGAKFRYRGGKEVWVRTQHNVIAAWSGVLRTPTFQSLCCFCHEDGDEDGNTLDTLVEVFDTAPPAPVATLWEICMPDEPGNPESPCEYVYVNSAAGRDLLLLRDGSSVYAEYACLDATAALNTVHVGELDPAQRLAVARGETK